MELFRLRMKQVGLDYVDFKYGSLTLRSEKTIPNTPQGLDYRKKLRERITEAINADTVVAHFFNGLTRIEIHSPMELFTSRLKAMQLELIEFKEGTIKMRSALHIPQKNMDDMRKKVGALIAGDPVVAAYFQNFQRIDISSPKPVEGK